VPGDAVGGARFGESRLGDAARVAKLSDENRFFGKPVTLRRPFLMKARR
jgi:hypothetical protein